MHPKNVWILIALAAVTAQAQWLDHPTPGTPRTKDGKPNLFAPAPRLAGKPDLSGVWQPDGTSQEENEHLLPGLGGLAVPGDDPSTFSKYFFNILSDFPPEQNPMRPEAAELFRQSLANPPDPSLQSPCLPISAPMATVGPAPFKIVQTPGLLVILYEVTDNNFRQVYLDGRKHVPNPQPSWMGYSTGKWEGNTLVVETIGFNDLQPMDGLGHPRSESTRITERYRRVDFGHMSIEITIDDPKNYTRPFTVKVAASLLPDTDILETICAENEKDRAHLKAN